MKQVKRAHLLSFLFFLFFCTLIYGQSIVHDTLTVLTYNVEYFKYPDEANRIEYFKKVIQKIKPDIACFQEIENDYSGKIILYKVMKNINDFYEYVKVEETGKDSYNLLIYNSLKIKFLFENIIEINIKDRNPRDINAYYLVLRNYINQDTIIVCSAHLKAGRDYEVQRYLEVKQFQKYVNQIGKDYLMVFMGDLNLYTSQEKAYMVLLDSMRIDLNDPINSPGEWHENSEFSLLHTQATRMYFNGRFYGGLDDRFDFILMSYQFFDGKDVEYISGSYKAFGNDGKHLNKSINDPVPDGVDKELADALYYASDHLPVFAKISYPAVNAGIVGEIKYPITNKISLNVYPNPFNNSTNIEIVTHSIGKLILSIFDLNGKKIFEDEFFANSRKNKFRIDADRFGMTTGVYFIKVTNGKYMALNKVLLIK